MKIDLKNKIGNELKPLIIILLTTFSFAIVSISLISYLFSSLALNFTINSSLFQNHAANENASSTPYLLLQKNITTRNIFNHEGTLPYEDTLEGSEGLILKNFDKIPCAMNEKLPVDLIGIIYTDNPETSIVSLRDPKITLADVYKEGQQIIDHENYSLNKVTSPTTAEFRHGNKKICVSLTPPSYGLETSSHELDSSDNNTLSSSFVAEQLGQGFSAILNSARLVPQIVDDKTVGFKIFAISKDSLFDKIRLMNGDIIKNINGINLEDPSQGFKIYEAFQNENSIALQVERNGEILNKKVTIE
jgi:type II secretion system protein C